MVLSDAGIKAAIDTGEIESDPRPVEYSPSAVDLLLGDEFQSWDGIGFWFPVSRQSLIWLSNAFP